MGVCIDPDFFGFYMGGNVPAQNDDWQQLFQVIEDQIVIIGLDHRIIAANPAVERATGLPAEKLVGQLCYEVLHCIHEAPQECPHSLLIQEKQPTSKEVEMEMLGGHYLLSISPLFNEAGELAKTIHVARDITTLKKEKLRNEEILHTAMDGFFLINRAGKFLDINEAACRITGYTRAELLEMAILDIDVKYTPPKLAAFMDEIAAQGGARFETLIKRKDGKVIDAELCTTYLEMDGGQFIVFMKDITERQLFLTALQESEKKFRTLFEASKDAIILSDVSGNINLLNCAAEEMFGYGPGELIGHPLTILMPEEYHHEHLEGMKRVSTTDQSAYVSQILEFKGVKKNGDEFPLELNITWWEIGGKTYYSGIIRDITKRKNAERALRESEAKLNAIFHAAQDGILVADAVTKMFLTGNKRICEMLGYGLNEISTLGVQDIHPPNELAFVIKQFERQANKEIEVAQDTPVLRKDGSVFFADISSSPVKFDEQEFLVGIFRDVTKRREVEAQSRQSQKLEAIGTLAGGIAHDFNNILSAILGYSELALQDISLDSIVHNEIEEVIKAGNRAKELVRQILTFSRQERGAFSVQKIQVIIKEVVKLLRSTIPTSIEIEQDIDDGCCAIHADPTQIHQLVMNLCTNAFHAMENSGGVLRITLQEIHTKKRVKTFHSYLEPGQYVRLQVVDTGAGIDKEVLNKIFDPYFSTKQKEKGTGLGLAVVHGIVETHGGNIEVESTLGKGVTFSIYFPATAESAKVDEVHVPSRFRGQGNVLFVDDEEALTGLGKKMLSQMGYEVTTEKSGVDALATFKKNPQHFDVIITDQTMPKMSGTDLAKKVFKIRPDMPVVLSSGYSTVVTDIDIKALGIKAFLLKPVSAEMFAQTLEHILGKK